MRIEDDRVGQESHSRVQLVERSHPDDLAVAGGKGTALDHAEIAACSRMDGWISGHQAIDVEDGEVGFEHARPSVPSS
jgi:hypothetical protein